MRHPAAGPPPHRVPGARMSAMMILLAVLAALVPTIGIVRDSSTGRPIPGVVVQPVGTASAPTVTDSAGRFTLDLASPTRLRLTRVGYAAAEVAANPGDSIVITLIP